jgi:hypothetical protein
MTDNEIMEKLEWCGCEECMAILDLIKRLKQENESLRRENSLVHMLLKDSWKSIEYKDQLLESHSFIPEPCKNCSNHPINGGSGICSCTLGDTLVY